MPKFSITYSVSAISQICIEAYNEQEAEEKFEEMYQTLDPWDLPGSEFIEYDHDISDMTRWDDELDEAPKCEADSDNHSDDLLHIYSGSTTPTYMCGYHYAGGVTK